MSGYIIDGVNAILFFITLPKNGINFHFNNTQVLYYVKVITYHNIFFTQQHIDEMEGLQQTLLVVYIFFALLPF